MESGLKPLRMPLMTHLQFSAMWGTMSILANYAFAYKISVTIFTLIRSCNIIATVLIGFLVFGERYSWQQLLCTCAVSVGIFSASMGEKRSLTSAPTSSCAGCSVPSPAIVRQDDGADLTIWLTGLAMLAFVQLIQGLLGHAQSRFYQRYAHLGAKDELCDEFLFTSHVASLLPFIALRDDITLALHNALASEPLSLPFQLPFAIPSRIAWLIFNSAAQTICLKGVFLTSAVVSPLTLTIILSVRKFLSVLFSITWFNNPWSPMHNIATVLIFGGAFAYSQAPGANAAKKNA
jgi:UDP-xylose/UDP-N-acetylglucosamine transporter B4